VARLNLDVKIFSKQPIVRLKWMEGRISPESLAAFNAGPVVEYLQERAKERFAQEGDAASRRWTPLHPATVKIRTREGYVPIRINDRTGQMKAWVTGARGEVLASEQATTLRWPGRAPGNINTKLRTAQYGNPKPKTPPRPVVALDEVDVFTVRFMLEQWVGAGNR